MIRRIAICAICAISLVTPASAAVREVPQSEMRGIVNAGQSIGLQQVLKTLARNVEGEAVDVRVFDADGLIYTILVMLPNGKMANVFIDAVSGQFIAPNSKRAKNVATAARNARGNNGKAKAANRSNGKSKSKGKSDDKGKGKNK